MRLLAIAATFALVVLFVSFTPGTTEADGGFALSIEPEELAWGEPLRVMGSYWPEGEVEVSARFSMTRLRPDMFRIPSIPPGDSSFESVIPLEDVSGLPEQPAPGWIEVIVRVGEAEVSESHVVTVDGRRPADSAYMTGEVRNVPSSQMSFVIVWSPVDDPAAYKFTWTDENGSYRTDYISQGEWFVGLYDLSEQWHAADDDLQAVTGYAKELSKEVTLTGRVITVRPGQVATATDFTLAPGPPPSDEVIRVSPTATEAPPRARATTQASSISKGWLGPTLLGISAGLLLAFVATTRWAGRRSR